MEEKSEIEAFPNTDPGKFLITLEKHTTVYAEDNSRIQLNFGENAQIKKDGSIEIELESAWTLKEKYDLTELEAKRLVLDTLSHEVEHYNSSDLESKGKIMEDWSQCPKLAGDIMNIVEDCYIDNKRLRKFEGLQRLEEIKKKDFYNRTEFNDDLNAENLVLTTAYVLLCDRRPKTSSKFINEYADKMEELKRQVIKADKQEERVSIAETIISTILDNVEIPEELDTPDFEDFEELEGKAEEVESEEERTTVKLTEEELEEREEEREEEIQGKSISIESDPNEEDEEEKEEEEEENDSDSGNNGSSDPDSEDEDSEDGESGAKPTPNSEDDGNKNGDSDEDSDSDADSENESEDNGSSSSESEEDGENNSDSENDGKSGSTKPDSPDHDKKKKRNSNSKGGNFNIDTTKFVAKSINSGVGLNDPHRGRLEDDDISEIEHESDLLSDDVKEVLEEMDDDKDRELSVNKNSGSDLDIKKSVRYLSGDKSQRDIYRVKREDRPDKRTIGVTIDASGSMAGKGMKQALESTTALALASEKLGDEFIANTHWSDVKEDIDYDKVKELGHDTDVTWITKVNEEFDVSDLENVTTRYREPIALGIRETRAEMQKSRKKGDKVLFVIHDGNPTINADGFPVNQNGVEEEAVLEVEEEVEKCRKLGFKVIGLAVGNDMEEWALDEMFGASGWFKFDPEDLPTEILRIYREQAY